MADSIAQYSFIPWLRRGIINQASTPGAGKQRAELKAKITLNVAAPNTVEQTIQLYGPGDVSGINAQSVIRVEPKNWITNFEPNYLPFIEFYEEDFPWRYTPSTENGTKLNPWTFLAVLKKDEFGRKRVTGSPLNVINITGDTRNFLPPNNQVWAWAHIHFNKALNNDGAPTNPNINQLDQELASNPDIAISRLFSPRKLEPNTEYYAFVIPTFENGRLAGLNRTANKNANDPSWDFVTDVNKEFPVYYEWYFKTGEVGDFEYLCSLLEPRVADKQVGIRDLDIQQPGYGINQVNDPHIVGLEGALIAPEYEPKPLTPTSDFPVKLQPIINLQEDLQQAGNTETPLVCPPLYGRWHALTKRLSIQPADSNWVHQLNKDPRYRVPGGMGTIVVQKNQEEYMKICWEQVGEVLEEEQKIRFLQLALAASRAIYAKHFVTQPVNTHILITKQVHSKILGSPVTIKQLIADSPLPVAATDQAFRKMVRPRGKLMRRFADHKKLRSEDILHLLNEKIITAADPKVMPGKVLTPDKTADELRPKLPVFLIWLIMHNIWVLLLLLLLAIVLFIFGARIIAIAVIAAAGGWYAWSNAQKKQIQASDVLRTGTLTVAAVNAVPALLSFSLVTAGSVPATAPVTGTSDTVEAANFRKAVTSFHGHLEATVPAPKEKIKLNLRQISQKILQATEPGFAFAKRWLPKIKLGETPIQAIRRVMHYPDIKKPMYEPLRDISTDYLVPNLHLIPPNTITLLNTNQPFIESYMVGLNHEMARELLWREYPTDQQGSYFRQFWDVSGFINVNNIPAKELAEQLRDIKPIHEWPANANLGDNNNREKDGDKSQLVLVIKGELLKRYPNTVIYAQQATWGKDEFNRTVLVLDGGMQLQATNPKLKFPLYGAKINPDITFLGFDLTDDQARGDIKEESDSEKNRPGNKPGWFFVIKEIPGEPRFGMDEQGTVNSGLATSWDQLAWSNLPTGIKCIDLTQPLNISVPGTIQWGNNSADMAYILYQKPVMVATHAREMLP